MMTAATLVRASVAFSSTFVLLVALHDCIAFSIPRQTPSTRKSPAALPPRPFRSAGKTSAGSSVVDEANHSLARPTGAVLRLHSIFMARQNRAGERQESFQCAKMITSHRCHIERLTRTGGDRSCFNVIATISHGLQDYPPRTDFCSSELWIPTRKFFAVRRQPLKEKSAAEFVDSSKVGWEVSVRGSLIGRLSPSTSQQGRFSRHFWIVLYGLRLTSKNNTVTFCPSSNSSSRLGQVAASINTLQFKQMFPRFKSKPLRREPFFLIGHANSGTFLYDLLQTGSSELRRRRDLSLQQVPLMNLVENRATNPLPAPTPAQKWSSGDESEAKASGRTNLPPDESPCRRVALNISTATLQAVVGDGEITSSRNFHLFDCAGRCVDSSPPASYHASLLQLIQRKLPETFHGIGRQRPGGGCCVPTEFSQDKVEFVYQRNGDVMLISLDNLIVTRCGCS